jgi:hypothetical protein
MPSAPFALLPADSSQGLALAPVLALTFSAQSFIK